MMERRFNGKQIFLKNIPDDYLEKLKCISISSSQVGQYIFTFVHSLEEMKEAILDAEQMLEQDGLLYLCYPKRKNSLNITGIHRDAIFPFLEVEEETGYMKNTKMRCNQMSSFDENYTLLTIKKDLVMKKEQDLLRKF